MQISTCWLSMVGLGIPEDRAQVYSDRVSRGEYLVMVEGSEDEIRQTESSLNRCGIQNWDIFNTSASGTTTSGPGGTTYTSGDRTAL